MTKELQIKTYDLDKPAQIAAMAGVLKNHIVKHKLFVPIAGKNYAMVEGWQFAGGLMGLFPRIKQVINLSQGQEYKWQAEVEVIDRKNDKIVSTGFALCSNKENKKKTFDEYAVLSMAQTRAIGKAYRNLLGWVMKLAGYEATPSEEMSPVGTQPQPAKENATTGQGNGELIECYKCPEGNAITEQEAKYSMRFFGKNYCRNCQKLAKKK